MNGDLWLGVPEQPNELTERAQPALRTAGGDLTAYLMGMASRRFAPDIVSRTSRRGGVSQPRGGGVGEPGGVLGETVAVVVHMAI